MRRYVNQINCCDNYAESKRSSPFIFVKYHLNYCSDTNDRQLVDALLKKAYALAERVNPQPANAGTAVRSHDTVLANAIAGVFSEFFWKRYLNFEDTINIVRETRFEGAASQIDLEIIQSRKRIEVRSSFPRNGISFSICHPEHQFDILGPYANNTYKPGEIKKDYYVRTLFVFQNPTDIIERVREDYFYIYLTGGATYEMMQNGKIYINKRLTPDDTLGAAGEANYRVIPFSRALDTPQIQALIAQ